jgi:hypothetical protein
MIAVLDKCSLLQWVHVLRRCQKVVVFTWIGIGVIELQGNLQRAVDFGLEVIIIYIYRYDNSDPALGRAESAVRQATRYPLRALICRLFRVSARRFLLH